MSPDFSCPGCAAPLSPNARSCGQCGAKRESAGGRAPRGGDGFDEDTFDYDEFLRREFGGGTTAGSWFTRMTAKERFWWGTAVILLAAFLAMALRGW